MKGPRKEADARTLRSEPGHIDLYYAHEDDPDTALEETMAAFDRLVREGKAWYVAASNYSALRLAAALASAQQQGLESFAALQVYYNLVRRDEFEGDLAALCEQQGLACIAYSALADGFLTGNTVSVSVFAGWSHGSGRGVRPGPLAELPRKNCWTVAERAEDATPNGVQYLLARARWDAEGVRDDVRSCLVEHLGDPDAVLVVDKTGDVKNRAGNFRPFEGEQRMKMAW